VSDELLTYEEAAKAAQVSRETIRYWIKVGRLQKIHTGISARSGNPTDPRIRRSDLLSSTTDEKLKGLEHKLDTQLVSIAQISARTGLTRFAVRYMQRKFDLKKYYLHNNREFFLDWRETLDKMEDDPYYRLFVLSLKADQRKVDCGCIYCYS
jgi:excisionase family DNA binding protein